jgi:hypothetical protein
MTTLTSKQFGDAAEHLVIGRLGLAGIPATKMPDAWPGYDLIAQSDNDRPPLRISVKALRAGNGKVAAFWYFDPDGWDWLVLIRVNVETGSPAVLSAAARHRNCSQRANFGWTPSASIQDRGPAGL